MTPEQQAVIDQLRAEGYAVVIWTPDEVGDKDIGHLEDIVISSGSDYLGD